MSTDQMENLLGVLKDMLLPENVVEVSEDAPPEKIQQYYDRMKMIYADGFRHRYSDISAFLDQKSPDVYVSLDIWLTALTTYGETNDATGDTYTKIVKILDHIRSEMIRLDRMKAVQEYVAVSIRINNELQKISEDMVNTANNAEVKVSNFHEQSIAILGIFSAVILAFMGGVSFSSGVLESISQASMFRLLITVLLLGFVLFNSVFVLMRFIAYIVYKKDPVGFKNGIKGFNRTLAAITIIIMLIYILGCGETIEKWGKISSETTSSTSTEIINNSAPETT